MRFQHGTAITALASSSRTTVTGTSGTSVTIIPGADSTLTISIQQYLLTWNDVTTPGQIILLSQLSDPTPFTVYQTGGGSLLIPMFDEIHNIGAYGLRAQNDSAGGNYSISVWYTVIIP